jgi:hypothetical protein
MYKDDPAFTVTNKSDQFEMKWFKFKARHIETMYKERFIAENHSMMARTIIILLCLMILWTILEVAISGDDMEMGLLLMRLIGIAAFICLIAYVYTQHYMENYENVTIITFVVMLFYKFGIEAGFGIVGTISYGLVPLCTYILFNVNFIKINLVNILSIILFVI